MDFSDLWRFDEEKNSLKRVVVVVVISKSGPMTLWYEYDYVMEQVVSGCGCGGFCKDGVRWNLKWLRGCMP